MPRPVCAYGTRSPLSCVVVNVELYNGVSVWNDSLVANCACHFVIKDWRG